jgi:hypothetical protein
MVKEVNVIFCHICTEIGQDDEADPGSLICRRHEDRIWSLLNEVAQSFAIISDPEYLISSREPSSDYTKGRPPCNLNPIALTDRRSRYTRPGDPVSAYRVLWAWRNAAGDSMSGDWREQFDGRTVGVLVAELKTAMPWLVKQPAITRFARHVACVADSLRRELPKEKGSDND